MKPMSEEEASLFWDTLLGVRGCPAHIWASENLTDRTCPDMRGYCCKDCPTKFKKICKKQWTCESNICGVGNVPRGLVQKIYEEGKPWSCYPAFSERIREEAKRWKRDDEET